MTEQINVPDRIEHLVLGEFVVVAQALAIEYPRLVQDDRILQAAAQRQTGSTDRFDILHETKGARAAYLLGVGVFRKIDDDVTIFRTEHRMREVDGEVEHKAVVRLEARPLIVLVDTERLLDSQIAL